ncbi:uncharacterized protein LOC105283940 [Ooceraea biroi]|uniref:uncharacterized protein LOC105283940 n=1 Tax=Ooceraea biroi TaxID=2015173 RepID=UPI000F085C81|nr:uncharacterized protein LOC105283940 [Ooceraea biroi]
MSVSFARCDDCDFFFMMTATDRIDTSLVLTLERKRNTRDDGDDASLNDMDDLSFLSLSSMPTMNDVECNDEFLRLTRMVRAVYLSYLHECLLSNYMTCYEEKDDGIQSVQVNKCADQMELNAVRLALETGLYRRNMLKMIADVKSYTVQKKPYKKLIGFLETPTNKIDVAVQTDDTWPNLHDTNDVEGTCVKSSCEELSQVTLPAVRDLHENEEIVKEINDKTDLWLLETMVNRESHDPDEEIMDVTDSQIMDSDTTVTNNNNDTVVMDNDFVNAIVKNEDDDSQDSLLRHMEDMFCESDDSSDLTRLIEKHSGVTTASIDKEIEEMRLETTDADVTTNHSGLSRSNEPVKCHVPRIGTSRGKLTFSRYKEMRSKTMKEINGNESFEEKRKRRINAVWFVERVHQVSRLRAKMTELSLTNYRKHGRIKEKFLYLFGGSEEEEMMPDSPIRIEEHLPACKERIAPWIVQYLMPFYKKRKIKDRQLFKEVAKYIADMLIMQNTFPEQECVSEYIENYFKNKRFIKTKQDIYL